jgi:4'-phosphopantetheinyl transferase
VAHTKGATVAGGDDREIPTQSHLARVPPMLPDTIHLWTFRLDIGDWRNRLAPRWLSVDEMVRAERLTLEQQQRRFVVCRTTLRAILGAYLERLPGELTFRQGPYGKPYVDQPRASRYLHFNVSHSDELALVAVSGQREVGVDLERARPLDGVDDLVTRYFAPAERLVFDRVPPDARLSTFYQCWTLKEAYLKACGVGLSRSLAEIDVTRAEGQPIRLLDVAGAGGARYWRGRTLDAPAGYHGALVVEGRAGISVTTLSEWLPATLTLPDAPPTVGNTKVPHG